MGKIQKSQDFQKPLLRNLKVHVYNQQKALPIKKPFVVNLVKNLLDFLGVSCQEISFYFVTEKKISILHKDFFNDPTVTDCITFPIDQEFLGEVFICPSVAIDYAKKKDLCPIRETILYLVHGILHLIGYDDLEKNKRKVMRRWEKKCLEHILKTFDIKDLLK